MFKKLFSACLVLSFGTLLIAGCQTNIKTCPGRPQCVAAKCSCPCKCCCAAHCCCAAKQCPKKCEGKRVGGGGKCGAKGSAGVFVRCQGGKKYACCSIECAKKCAAMCKDAVVVNMKCPCGAQGKEEVSKTVDGVEQHYCCPGCLAKS